MELMNIIEERRSVRKYEDKDMPKEYLDKIFEAVRWAPSWANTQCWDIIVVKDKNIRESLQKTISPKNPATRSIVSASVLLALCGKTGESGYYKGKVTTKFGDWLLFDLGIATQNICLTAQALGLGTVIVGLFDHDKAKEILEVPDTHEVVALIPVGYPAHKPKPPKRKAVEEFVRYDTF